MLPIPSSAHFSPETCQGAVLTSPILTTRTLAAEHFDDPGHGPLGSRPSTRRDPIAELNIHMRLCGECARLCPTRSYEPHYHENGNTALGVEVDRNDCVTHSVQWRGAQGIECIMRMLGSGRPLGLPRVSGIGGRGCPNEDPSSGHVLVKRKEQPLDDRQSPASVLRQAPRASIVGLRLAMSRCSGTM